MDVRTTSRASFVSGGFRAAQALGRGLLTYRCAKRHLQCIALSFVAAAFMASSLEAQQRRRVIRPQDRRIPVGHSAHQPNRENTPQLLVEPSAPIANLFTRAQDGITRADWKFAIDCLQRIIDDPGNSLVRRSSGATEGTVLYESVRRSAVRRLGSLPPEGLRRYRLLYDGKAKRLYEQGRAAHDPERLRVVVDRYLLTRYGDDAADLLASWAGRRPESPKAGCINGHAPAIAVATTT